MAIMDQTATEAAQELAILKQIWTALAPNIQQAEAIRQQATGNPDLLADPRSDALVRWLDTFERDIVALKTLVAAADDPAVHLSLDEVQLARRASEKLLKTLQHEREQSGASSRVAASS
jgi:hypothetical protein